MAVVATAAQAAMVVVALALRQGNMAAAMGAGVMEAAVVG